MIKKMIMVVFVISLMVIPVMAEEETLNYTIVAYGSTLVKPVDSLVMWGIENLSYVSEYKTYGTNYYGLGLTSPDPLTGSTNVNLICEGESIGSATLSYEATGYLTTSPITVTMTFNDINIGERTGIKRIYLSYDNTTFKLKQARYDSRVINASEYYPLMFAQADRVGYSVVQASPHSLTRDLNPPPLNPPISDFSCNNAWYGETAPFDLSCANEGSGYSSCSWTVYWPDEIQTYSDSECDGFTDLTLTAPGNYDVGLMLQNTAGSDFELKRDYVLILGGGVTPNVTPTIIPNATPIPLFQTLSPTLSPIINSTEYRVVIENTVIGNLTAPLLDFMDDWTDSLKSLVTEITNFIGFPIVSLTDIILEVLDIYQTAFDNLAGPAVLFLYWVGLMFAVIPVSVWWLINYKLVIEIIKAVLET